MAKQPNISNSIRDKLGRDEVVLSMTVRLVRTNEIAAIAFSSGHDSLYIDMEHNTFSIDTVAQICQAALPLGIAPLVRVPSATSEYIPRVLEGGALGIIVPHVESAAEARLVVDAIKYPPLGTRSLGGALPQLRYQGYPAAETMEAVNAATFTVVMIESDTALNNVEEIASVDGVDMLMMGTNDLCSSLGIAGQYDHPLVRKAYERLIDSCLKNGKHVGIGGLASRPDLVKDFVDLGARYVSVGSDLGFLSSEASRNARQLRETLQGPKG